jgi:Asp-tRNA(Asn)/Glu-tRNA(Gln) amidotransferase A subunit family amidase
VEVAAAIPVKLQQFLSSCSNSCQAAAIPVKLWCAWSAMMCDDVYPDQLAWPGIATLPGLPSTAIPTGFAPDGLPVGVQMVGPWLEDPTPLKLAELIEREFGCFVPPKMFDD